MVTRPRSALKPSEVEQRPSEGQLSNGLSQQDPGILKMFIIDTLFASRLRGILMKHVLNLLFEHCGENIRSIAGWQNNYSFFSRRRTRNVCFQLVLFNLVPGEHVFNNLFQVKKSGKETI